MTLRRDDVSNWACLSGMLCVSSLMRTHRQALVFKNVTKNTPHVTPSPMYLEVPSLPEPSTTLMFNKIPIQMHMHDNEASDIKLYQTPYSSCNGMGKQIYVLLTL